MSYSFFFVYTVWQLLNIKYDSWFPSFVFEEYACDFKHAFIQNIRGFFTKEPALSWISVVTIQVTPMSRVN